MRLAKRLKLYISWPGLVVYFRRSARARVAIQDDRGRLLLVQGLWKRWYDDDGWSLPGGGINTNEEPRVAAVRELSEELGLQIAETALQPLAHEHLRDHGISYEVYLFSLRLHAKPTLTLRPKEIAAARWYSRAELQAITLKPDVRRALELLAATR